MFSGKKTDRVIHVMGKTNRKRYLVKTDLKYKMHTNVMITKYTCNLRVQKTHFQILKCP